MKRLLKALNSQKAGFTLVELIIAIALISVMSGTIVLNASGLVSHVEARPNESNADNMMTVKTNVEVISSLGTAEDQIDLAGVQSSADEFAYLMEYKVVQTALDTMIIREGLKAVKATAYTADMTSFPSGHPLYPAYMRDPASKARYSCDCTGQVSQEK